MACSAVLYFGLMGAYSTVYSVLFEQLGQSPALFLLIKFTLAFLLFFPSAFFMGGTLPMMTQYVVMERSSLGVRASALYAINTIGAATGAMLAGFLLPWWLGVKGAYLFAMIATTAIALAALWLSARQAGAAPIAVDTQQTTEPPPQIPTPTISTPVSHTTLIALASLSGFVTLALQVLWIRMFAQVLHNSVYTYAIILGVFLLALAMGATAARWIAARLFPPLTVLPALLVAGAIVVAASPLVFAELTNGVAYLGGDAEFGGYVTRIVGLVVSSIGLPVVVLGALFPYLFKLSENGDYGPGESVGRLVTWNTLAGIAGSLAAGFALLGWFGLWSSVLAMACLLLLGAAVLLLKHPSMALKPAIAVAVSMALVFTVLDPRRLPTVRINSTDKQEQLLAVWEGADATVAVIKQHGHLRTKLNNWYTLGSTGDTLTQQLQTHLPMLLHGQAKSVFYLGLAWGRWNIRSMAAPLSNDARGVFNHCSLHAGCVPSSYVMAW